jgi:hypothetical protein
MHHPHQEGPARLHRPRRRRRRRRRRRCKVPLRMGRRCRCRCRCCHHRRLRRAAAGGARAASRRGLEERPWQRHCGRECVGACGVDRVRAGQGCCWTGAWRRCRAGRVVAATCRRARPRTLLRRAARAGPPSCRARHAATWPPPSRALPERRPARLQSPARPHSPFPAPFHTRDLAVRHRKVGSARPIARTWSALAPAPCREAAGALLAPTPAPLAARADAGWAQHARGGSSFFREQVSFRDAGGARGAPGRAAPPPAGATPPRGRA